MRGASEIRWGTNFENAIAFEPFPTDGSAPTLLDSIRTWRRPVPGSRRARNDAGVTDAWIAARDHMLAGRARHFGGQGWGANGLQAFIDWASEGNTFRLIPDRRYPDFYVGDCYLEEPFENPEPQLEETDGTQSIDLLIRQQAVDFSQAIRGVMFEYVPGMDITKMGGTFTRATPATYIDRNGIVRTAASGAIRDAHFIDGVRHTLMEPARTQLVTQPQTPASWTDFGTPVITTGHVDPWGGSVAILVEDNDGAAVEGKLLPVTFTADGTKVVTVAVRAGSAAACSLSLFDNTAAAHRHLVNVTWNGANAPTLATIGGSGTLYPSVGVFDAAGNRWWLISFSAASVIAANDNRIFLYAAGTTGANTGTTYFAGANAWNDTFPTSWQPTSGHVRNADVLEFTAANLDTPQALTSYCKFVNLDEVGVNRRVWQISGANDLGPRHLLYRASTLTLYHQNANGGTAVTSGPAGAVAIGDLVEFRGVLSGDGSVIGHKTVNGGAETSGSTSAINTPAAAWGSAGTSRLYINADGAGTQVGSMALRSLRFMAGERSLSEIRAA